MYMTLELSPRYRPAVQRTEKDMTLAEFLSEITAGQEWANNIRRGIAIMLEKQCGLSRSSANNMTWDNCCPAL
jgi:hypothetical protein